MSKTRGRVGRPKFSYARRPSRVCVGKKSPYPMKGECMSCMAAKALALQHYVPKGTKHRRLLRVAAGSIRAMRKVIVHK